jgi:hypothetical protein
LVEHPKDVREFAPDDVGGALAFVDSLPADLNRVYVDVWEATTWRFVYGDNRRYVARLLGLVVNERRFRVRGVDLVDLSTMPAGPATLHQPSADS